MGSVPASSKRGKIHRFDIHRIGFLVDQPSGTQGSRGSAVVGEHVLRFHECIVLEEGPECQNQFEVIGEMITAAGFYLQGGCVAVKRVWLAGLGGFAPPTFPRF